MTIETDNRASPSRSENGDCDALFVQWLEAKKVEGKLIFHWGTGRHHLVGRRNHERGDPNEVIAMTASRAEHDEYVNFIMENPEAANHYKVMFGDAHTLSARMLPAFDIAGLFGLGEFGGGRPEHVRLDDRKLTEMFLSRISAEGRLVFSGNHPGAAEIIKDFVWKRRIAVDEEYESLVVCRRNW